MPDDERLGGTRDPHEYGRRHRRSDNPPPPPPAEQPRRRRRSVESGGVSVADLVQRHTGSRPDLTPVNPDQLRQNGVMTSGRRARRDEPPPPPPPQARQATAHPSIAAALDGADGFPPDRAAPRPGGQPGDNFPRDEAGHRPGGASSYFTIPSDALRSYTDDPGYQDNGYPADRRNGAPDFPPDAGAPHRNGHRAGEGSGPPGFFEDAPRPGRRPGEASGTHLPVPDAGRPGRHGTGPAHPPPADDPRNGYAPDGDAPRPGRRHGRGPADDPSNGFAPGGEPPRPGRRRGKGPAPAANGFAPDLPAPGLPGDDLRNGFAPDGDLPLPGRRPGEASVPLPPVGDAPRPGRRRGKGRTPGDDPRNGFGPDGEPPRPTSRRGGPAPTENHGPGDDPRNGYGPDGEPSSPGRGRGNGDPRNGFGPDGEPPHPGRRRGNGPAPTDNHAPGDDPRNGYGPDGEPPRPSRRRGSGPAPADAGHTPGDDPRNGFGPDGEPPRASRRRGKGSPPADGHLPGDPRNGFGPDGDLPLPGRRPGEASMSGGGAPRPGRRPGEASVHMPIPGDGFAPDAPGRRPGEASVHLPSPVRRVGEDSVRMPVHDGFPNGFPPDVDGRRVGEGSGPRNGFPADGGAPRRDRRERRFPPGGRPDEPGRPEGAARRRAARAAERQDETGFPGEAPEGEPVDGPPKPRRTSGVPAVPPPPPPMGDDDLVTMTTEMEAIGDDVQKRRTIDHTLARFSAVHDEIKAEEREKKAKRRKLRPWERDDEMDRLDELEAQQSMAMVIPTIDPRDEDDEDDDPRKAKRKRRWRKGKNAGKAFAIFFAGLIFLSSAVGWGFLSYIESSSQQVDALDPDSDAIKDAAAQLGDENFLLVGSDTRAGATAEDGVGDADTIVGARSDTVMVAHVPKNRERVVVVSFPRDLEVTRPACEGWDPKTGNYTGEQHPEAERVKLNTAYQVGGPKCVTKLVQNLSGLAINHFVGIDFHGFKDMVDAVQGVEVCVERPMKDTVLGMVVPEAGKNVKLTGDQALNFVRARHVIGDKTSDYGRIIRQQRFLSSLLRKAMSSEVLLNPGKLTKFVDAFSGATFGDNIGVEQLFTLGQSMQGVEAGKVTFITIPTVGIANERNNEDLRVDDSNALFEAIRQDVPLPGEVTTQDDASKKGQTDAQRSGLMQAQPQDQPVDPTGIKLQVLNGGNETGGIAGDTADQLADLGFEILRVDSAPEPTDKTVIKYSKSHEAQAQAVQAAVPGATLVEDPSMAGAIILVIGPDFDGKVVAPGGGAPVDVPDNLSTVNAGDVSCA